MWQPCAHKVWQCMLTHRFRHDCKMVVIRYYLQPNHKGMQLTYTMPGNTTCICLLSQTYSLRFGEPGIRAFPYFELHETQRGLAQQTEHALDGMCMGTSSGSPTAHCVPTKLGYNLHLTVGVVQLHSIQSGVGGGAYIVHVVSPFNMLVYKTIKSYRFTSIPAMSCMHAWV